jgi:uncharacterized protein
MGDYLQRYRYLIPHLPKPTQKRLVVITGARQTGKTTLSKNTYATLRYINLDAPENRDILRHLPTAAWPETVGPAVLDEAQKEPVVFEKVKHAFDAGDVSFTVLTGSSQILLLKNIRETLAGRAFFYELWPLMQCEIGLAHDTEAAEPPLIQQLLTGEEIKAVLRAAPRVLMGDQDYACRKVEDHVLRWGGMPALLPLSPPDRWKWLKDYGYTYLERDVSDLARLDDLSPFRAFHRLSALRSSKLLNYSELARDAGISVDTSRRYLEYLRLSYQTFLLEPYHRNLTSSLVKTPKLYWADIGMMRRLTGFKGPLTGELYETMVVSEVMKWIRTCQLDVHVYFYRTRSGMEMDLLIEGGSGVIGMEIKARESIARKDIRPMKEIASSLGKAWFGGLVVYRGNEIKQIGNPEIWAVPSRRLFQPLSPYTADLTP